MAIPFEILKGDWMETEDKNVDEGVPKVYKMNPEKFCKNHP